MLLLTYVRHAERWLNLGFANCSPKEVYPRDAEPKRVRLINSMAKQGA